MKVPLTAMGEDGRLAALAEYDDNLLGGPNEGALAVVPPAVSA